MKRKAYFPAGYTLVLRQIVSVNGLAVSGVPEI